MSLPFLVSATLQLKPNESSLRLCLVLGFSEGKEGKHRGKPFLHLVNKALFGSWIYRGKRKESIEENLCFVWLTRKTMKKIGRKERS